MLLEVGRVCIKTAGHETGLKCIVIDNAGDGFAIVVGPRVKKRRCNIRHLEILPHKIDLKKGASEKEAVDALLKAGFVSSQDLSQKPTQYTPTPRGAERKIEVKTVAQKKTVVKTKK
ncbi:TPA: 50S ribosomal protein L14e [archaeon]|uniref:50S ribosomal protein L14e n=1 Tax=Candidatus Naiadarchaeum limnaeum TaxID=2756139 RepID=A0A832V1M7_9ARCH|nr:50S ribosomal protein L14e [Candidatus Naiadarchaeales archaeon SRR2090153.bin1042]HIK00508.1 50S ribosomal protein L14e [Candidatus Naiadarchaeum limnaeum]